MGVHTPRNFGSNAARHGEGGVVRHTLLFLNVEPGIIDNEKINYRQLLLVLCIQ